MKITISKQNKQNLINTAYYVVAFIIISLYLSLIIFIRLRFIVTRNEAAKKDVKFLPIFEEFLPLTAVLMLVAVLIYSANKYVSMDVFILFVIVAMLIMLNSTSKIKYVDQYTEIKGSQIFQSIASFIIIAEYAVLLYLQYHGNKFTRNMRIIFGVSIFILLTLSMLLF